MPSGKMLRIGVWEDGQFIGCVLYGYGANLNIGRPYGLRQDEVCELMRVALREHKTPTSRIVAISLRLLRAACPGIRLVVSYADSNQGHTGTIYRAGNWIYCGKTVQYCVYVGGRRVHRKTVSSRFGTVAGLPKIREREKYKYVYLFDKTLEDRVRSAVSGTAVSNRRGRCESDPHAPLVSQGAED